MTTTLYERDPVLQDIEKRLRSPAITQSERALCLAGLHRKYHEYAKILGVPEGVLPERLAEYSNCNGVALYSLLDSVQTTALFNQIKHLYLVTLHHPTAPAPQTRDVFHYQALRIQAHIDRILTTNSRGFEDFKKKVDLVLCAVIGGARGGWHVEHLRSSRVYIQYSYCGALLPLDEVLRRVAAEDKGGN